MTTRLWKSITHFFQGASAAAGTVWIFFALTGAFQSNSFDGALRLLAHHYTQKGLLAYQDFGVVYPPGQFWLIGGLLPFHGAWLRMILLTIFVLLAFVFWWRTTRHSSSVGVPGSSFLFFAIPPIFTLLSNDPLSLPLLGTLVVLEYRFLHQPTRQNALATFLLSSIILLFRWDWPIFFFCLQILLLLISSSILFALQLHKPWIPLLKRWAIFLGILFLGSTLSITLTLLHFWHKGALSALIEFIFTIPVQVILEYRKLPIVLEPRIWKSSALLTGTFLAWIGSIFLYLTSYQPWKKEFWQKVSIDKIRFGLLVSTPTVLIPYATGRADIEHAFPLSALLILCLSFIQHLPRIPRLTVWIITGLTLAPLLSLTLMRYSPNLPWTVNKVEWYVEAGLKNCRPLVQDLTAKSIFVGRYDYTRFIINTPMLYFTRPDLPPATPSISDEPGLQNSCEYGEQIAENLHSAPKPMIAFLETSLQNSEPNATASMVSCGSIEAFLASQSSRLIGTCESYGTPFDVRVYGDNL